jgi:hypothetical protein
VTRPNPIPDLTPVSPPLPPLLQERNDLKDLLRHAAVMLGELRTGSLTPKAYYELYMSVFDHLGTLEAFFSAAVRAGTPAADLYEAVQHAGNVLPRLYLMVTAGSVYIRSGQASSKDVLVDLMDYVKGVQHPMRGLFVRYYLVQRMKDKLAPAAAGGADAATTTTARYAIDFLTANLVEMNRLWVRMQAPAGGVVRNRKRRERERQDLRILVGANLTRLAALEGLDLDVYRSVVLPPVCEEIVSCADRIAQAYLVDSLLQVFPLDFHLRTLDTLLGLFPKLVPDHATLKTVALSLLARIKEGSTLHGDHINHPANAAPAAVPGVVAAASVLGLPRPPLVAGRLPGDVDVFGTILSYISTLAAEENGPFRPAAGGAGAKKKAGGGATGEDSDDEGAGGGAAAGPSPSKTALSRAPSSKLAALREAGDAAAAQQPMASLLGIFTALADFSLALYPGHRPYVDAVLGAAAKALCDSLGVVPAPDPSSVTAAGRPQTGSASAAIPAAREALAHLLEGSEGGNSATGDNATSSSSSSSASAPAAEAAAPPQAPGASASAVGLDEACSHLVVGLLETAQAALGLDVLQLTHYAPLMAPLAYRYRREVAGRLLTAVLSGAQASSTSSSSSSSSALPPEPVRVTDIDTARRLYNSLQPLVRDDAATPSDALPEGEERALFAREQAEMARLVALLGPAPNERTASTLRGWFDILCVARDFLSWGGPRRISATYPALLHEGMALAAAARSTRASDPALKIVFAFVHDVCFTLAVADHGELALKMFLEAAAGCDDAQFAQEFFSQGELGVGVGGGDCRRPVPVSQRTHQRSAAPLFPRPPLPQPSSSTRTSPSRAVRPPASSPSSPPSSPAPPSTPTPTPPSPHAARSSRRGSSASPTRSARSSRPRGSSGAASSPTPPTSTSRARPSHASSGRCGRPTPPCRPTPSSSSTSSPHTSTSGRRRRSPPSRRSTLRSS